MDSLKKQINRIERLVWYIMAMIVRPFIKVKNNRIFCWSYSAKKYACNPRALTEYILENHANEYEIYWGFDKDVDVSMLDERIHVVRKYNLSYLYALYSSKFVFYNTRNCPRDSMFVKKQSQKYIMMWHGSFALKRIEKDAVDSLNKRYIQDAKQDSRDCDLMLSNSSFFTNLIYKSFWYNGEVLEKCSPRNDVLYNNQLKINSYVNIRKSLNLSPDCKIVLYAPTFRGNGKDLACYNINWDKLLPFFEKMLDGKVEILLRLHPNIANIEGVDRLLTNEHVHNVTQIPDITELLFAADVMISDYTSAMFDYAILRKPCFIYAVDKDEYNRGFYWKFEQLPFELAENEEQLIKNIIHFNTKKYQLKLNHFINNVWGLDEDGYACERLLKWMNQMSQQLKREFDHTLI